MSKNQVWSQVLANKCLTPILSPHTGFAPKEIITRINDLHPKVLVTATNGVEVNKIVDYKRMVDEALANTPHAPKRVIVYKREENNVPHNMLHGRDVYWHELAQVRR